MNTIYMLIFKTSGKKYIGLTKNNVIHRLKSHINFAMNGGDTYLARAIRKYGPSDITIQILAKIEKREDACEAEKYFIKLYNTNKTGYNLTSGGEGGNTSECMSKKRYKLYIQRKQQVSKGKNNPKYCGKTDKEIINIAVEYFLRVSKMIRKRWTEFCKQNKLPQNYSKFRFNGNGYSGFVQALKTELKNRNIEFSEQDFYLSYEERYKEEYNKKISESLKKNVENKKNREKN